MGFWDKALNVAKDLGTSIVNDLESNANELRKIKKEYANMDDNELFDIVRGSGFLSKSKQEKGVAYSILKKRGHSPETISEGL